MKHARSTRSLTSPSVWLRTSGNALRPVAALGAMLLLGSTSDAQVLEGPVWTAESDQTGAWLGRPVATAGDVNGDGYDDVIDDGFDDVIVGACRYSEGEQEEGRAFVYLGSASGLSPDAAWTAESDQVMAHFGHSVATAGDVNADGYGDVIIGVDGFTNGQSEEGRAVVFHGSAAGLGSTFDWAVESNQGGTPHFGVSVGSAGDVNGDGYGDVIVGARGYDAGESAEGRAFVYLGSAAGLGTNASWTAESNQDGGRMGISVGTARDVNGDSYADVIVGAAEFDDGEADEGRVSVFLGSAAGLAATAAWERVTRTPR